MQEPVFTAKTNREFILPLTPDGGKRQLNTRPIVRSRIEKTKPITSHHLRRSHRNRTSITHDELTQAYEKHRSIEVPEEIADQFRRKLEDRLIRRSTGVGIVVKLQDAANSFKRREPFKLISKEAKNLSLHTERMSVRHSVEINSTKLDPSLNGSV